MKKNKYKDYSNQEIPKHRSKKNTKKWCGGHEGRDHLYSWRSSNKYADWMDYSCDKCGRLEDFWVNWWINRWEKPEIGSHEPKRKKVKNEKA